jgi:hypothetical protein
MLHIYTHARTHIHTHNTYIHTYIHTYTGCFKKSFTSLKAYINVLRGYFSPKVNMFCTLSKERVYSPFFVMEPTVSGIVYLDMPQQFLVPQLDEDGQEGRIHFQHDGTTSSLPLTSARVPQHPFPWSVDW